MARVAWCSGPLCIQYSSGQVTVFYDLLSWPTSHSTSSNGITTGTKVSRKSTMDCEHIETVTIPGKYCEAPLSLLNSNSKTRKDHDISCTVTRSQPGDRCHGPEATIYRGTSTQTISWIPTVVQTGVNRLATFTSAGIWSRCMVGGTRDTTTGAIV